MNRTQRQERRAARRARYEAWIASLLADFEASPWIHMKVRAEIADRMGGFVGCPTERKAVESSLLLKILRRERAQGLLGPLLKVRPITAPAHWLDAVEDRTERNAEAS